MARPLSEMSTEELLALRESLASNLGVGSLETPSEEIDFTDYSAGNALTRGLSRGVDVAQMGYGSALEGLGKVAGLEGLQQYGGDVVADFWLCGDFSGWRCRRWHCVCLGRFEGACQRYAGKFADCDCEGRA